MQMIMALDLLRGRDHHDIRTMCFIALTNERATCPREEDKAAGILRWSMLSVALATSSMQDLKLSHEPGLVWMAAGWAWCFHCPKPLPSSRQYTASSLPILRVRSSFAAINPGSNQVSKMRPSLGALDSRSSLIVDTLLERDMITFRDRQP